MKMNDKENEIYAQIKGKLMRKEDLEYGEFELLRKFNIYNSSMFEDKRLTLIVADISGNLYAFRSRIEDYKVNYFEQPYKVSLQQTAEGKIYVVPDGQLEKDIKKEE